MQHIVSFYLAGGHMSLYFEDSGMKPFETTKVEKIFFWKIAVTCFGEISKFLDKIVTTIFKIYFY